MGDIYEASEDQEQIALFHWARIQETRTPELALLYAIPNGGKRMITTARRLKATGVKAGVPDICLPVARGKYHGLYIELKRKHGGKVSAAQKIWLDALKRQGYLAVVCHGWLIATKIIREYLEAKNDG